ncbi:hypothetical protein SAMN04487895_101740 [Paenibacillus sophorae]|uniref:Phage portal protein, SPP1 Gp6-like n=1 Tax=Paenibacillus sophorae TaxID=1333845 RepID=A0A1H8H380_9BACL|nr:hypothetical protein [Paenibacillus sophorae]QWU14428.1 hypothetical protein KP014_21205 [Paenibacillus sophorae]SEN50595.1 hypothetical protein SAMN04487895_101740 [Paenibacillus sophorae]
MANNQINTNTNDPTLEREFNTYEEYLSTFVEGFMSQIFSSGIIDEIDIKKLQSYFANPDKYQNELEKIAQYFYIASAEVFQLFELVKILPTLNHKINVFDKNKNYEKNLSICNKFLYKIKHKTLTRDILMQEITAGTLVGMWLGEKKRFHPYIFDDLKYIFPAYRKNGDWIAVIDLEWFTSMKEDERKIQFENLKPYVTEAMYENFLTDKSNTDLKYIELPQERTFILRTHTTKRNQRLGINWSTTGLFDLIHKSKLKNMEKSVANKIINAIAVLTIGSSDNNGENSNLKLKPTIKKKIHNGVKAALEKNQSSGVTVVSVPDYASIDFPDMKSEALDPKKFESVNNDIQSSYGLSSAVLNGAGGNFASAKLNLETMYKRIAVLLEDIEQEVYGKLFNLILSSADSDNYVMEYDKQMPISGDKRLDALFKLHSEGFAVKHIVDSLDGIQFDDFINQSLYESEVMKLIEKIKPYQTSYTTNSNTNGRDAIDDSSLENENTIKSRTTDANNTPES